MTLTAKRFQVFDYRNIDESAWTPLEHVTAFVGRKDAGRYHLAEGAAQMSSRN